MQISKKIMLAKEQKTRFFANFSLVISAIIWGSTFFITRASLRDIDAVALLSYRSLLSIFILWLGLLVFKKKNIFRAFKTGAILGFLLFSFLVTITIGLYYTTAANSGFIAGMALLFIPLINFIFWRKKLSLVHIISIVVAGIGLWLVTGGIAGINRGDFLTLLSTALWAMYIIFVENHVAKTADLFILNFQQWFVMAILCWMTILIFHLPTNIGSFYALYTIIYLALFATILACVLQFYAQRYVSAFNVAIVLLLEPVFAGMFAWTLGDESFNWMKLFGCILILLAIVFSELPLFKVREKI